MAEVKFKKKGSLYEAEVVINDTSVIHIERKNSGSFVVEQSHFEDTKYAPLSNPFKQADKNLEINVNDEIFPVCLRLVSSTEVTGCEIIGDGEQKEKLTWVSIALPYSSEIDIKIPLLLVDNKVKPMLIESTEGLISDLYITSESLTGWLSVVGFPIPLAIPLEIIQQYIDMVKVPYELSEDYVMSTAKLRNSFEKVKDTCEAYPKYEPDNIVEVSDWFAFANGERYFPLAKDGNTVYPMYIKFSGLRVMARCSEAACEIVGESIDVWNNIQEILPDFPYTIDVDNAILMDETNENSFLQALADGTCEIIELPNE